MAWLKPVLAVLRAIGRCSRRELQAYKSVGGQNFFLFVLFVALQPESAAFFALILLAVVLFSLVTDPLAKVPIARQRLWPLRQRQWTTIRLGSLLFSPLTWIVIILVFKIGRPGIAVLAAVIGLRIVVSWTAARLPQFAWRAWLLRIPSPPGSFGLLIRLHWRAMVQTLDLYVAIIISLATSYYVLSGHALPSRAHSIIALVIVLALSTQAQVLIGMDGPGAIRYRYFPLRGWRILLAKDLATLSVMGILTAFIDPLAGVTGGLAAFTIGHYRCATNHRVQIPWQFTEGSLAVGVLQIIGLFAVGLAAAERWWIFPLCVFTFGLSVIWFGYVWERTVSPGDSTFLRQESQNIQEYAERSP